jgi:hypothetical protein
LKEERGKIEDERGKIEGGAREELGFLAVFLTFVLSLELNQPTQSPSKLAACF